MSRSSWIKALLVTLLPLVGAWAFSSASPERALARGAGDAQLQWGPCPPFMPEGCALAVLHGDPAKANADVFLKLPAGATIPDHWHTSAERMVLVAGKLHVHYEGHEKTLLEPGMYAYGPAKLRHSATCGDGGPCVLFIAFESAVDAFPAESSAGQ